MTRRDGSRPEAIRRGDIPGVQIRQRATFSCAVEPVLEALTATAGVEQWMADRVRSRDDGVWVLESDDFEGRPLTEEVVQGTASGTEIPWALRSLEPAWEIRTRVTWELTGSGTKCDLSLLHQDFEHLPLSDCLTHWEFYRRRWRAALARLGRHLNRSLPA